MLVSFYIDACSGYTHWSTASVWEKKAGKYSHISSTYHFHLIAMETSGAIGLKCGSSL